MNSIKGLTQFCAYPLAKFRFGILDIIILIWHIGIKSGNDTFEFDSYQS